LSRNRRLSKPRPLRFADTVPSACNISKATDSAEKPHRRAVTRMRNLRSRFFVLASRESGRPRPLRRRWRGILERSGSRYQHHREPHRQAQNETRAGRGCARAFLESTGVLLLNSPSGKQKGMWNHAFP
jgi:hypothetical protein